MIIKLTKELLYTKHRAKGQWQPKLVWYMDFGNDMIVAQHYSLN